MWRFEDNTGVNWDVALGRESWGVLCALFAPQGGGQVRQFQLTSASEREAVAELDALEPSDWRAMLEQAQPKQ